MNNFAIPARVVLAIAAAVMVSRASGEEWDLAADWSNTENPNGAWSYNDGPDPMTFHWDSWHDTGSPGWAWGLYNVPSWVQHQTSPDCVDAENGQIWTHADKGPTRGNITWTAPSEGLYAISGGTWWAYHACPPGDHSGRRMDWRFLLNGDVLSSGNVGDGDAFTSENPARFGRVLCLTAGDVLRVEYQRTTAHSTVAVLDWHVETPPTCREDIEVNGVVDVGDLLVLLAAWGDEGDCHGADLDESGEVAVGDLLTLLAAWGECK